MATTQWLGGSDDWNTGSLWSGGVAPDDPATIAVIAAAGTYAVTVGAGETFATGGATLDQASATLAIGYNGAELDLDGGVFDLAAGTLVVNGVLAGGTLDLAGGSLTVVSGTLSDMTVVGELDFGTDSGNAVLADGFTLDNPVAGQQGTIGLTGYSLRFHGQETLTDDLLRIGTASDLYSSHALYVGGTLALDQASTLALNGAQSFLVVYTDDTPQNFGVYSGEIDNAGLITLAGTGDTISAGLGGFTNTGSISIGAKDLFALTLGANSGAPQGSYLNTGIIAIAAGGTFALAAPVSAAGFGTVQNNGGTVVLQSAFDNTGNVLTLGAAGDFTDTVLQGGTVIGGTIDPAGGTLVFAGGTFDGVTWNAGSFDVPAGQTLTIENGFSLATGAGLLTVEGALIFADAETLAGDSITLAGILGTSGAGLLTIGAGTTITASGTAAITGAVDNLGSIAIGTGTLGVDFSAATGQGAISVGSGATLVANGAFAFAELGAVAVAGALVIGGTLENAGQTIDVAPGTNAAILGLIGTIAGGTVRMDGGTLNTSGAATFSDVTLEGELALTGTRAALTLVNGFSAADIAGTGPGTLAVTGPADTLTIGDSETLDDATILLGNAQSVAYNYVFGDTLNFGPTLTLGPNLLLADTGTQAVAGLTGATAYLNGGTLVNQGTIAAVGSLSYLSVGGTLVNQGTLFIGSGATLDLYQYYTPGISISNLGSIVNQGGLLDLDGYFDNTGQTLAIASGTGFANVDLREGQILNGTVLMDGGTLGFTGNGALAGVTFDGVLDLSADGSGVYLSDVILHDSSGTGPGEILLTGASAALTIGTGGFAADVETLDNATIFIGNAGGAPDSIAVNYATTLTLGPSLVVQAIGAGGLNTLGGQGTIINQGTIIAAGGVLAFANSNPGTFINQGTLVAATGGTLELTAQGSLGGFGNLILAGGVLEIAGTLQNTGATLAVAPGTDLANAILAGTIIGGTVADQGGTLTYNRGTLAGVEVLGTLDLATRSSSLTATGAFGVAGIEGGNGVIDLTGTASTLTLGSAETLDNVLIEFGQGGTIANQDTLLSTAGLTFGPGATLVDSVAGGNASLQFANFGGSIVNDGTIVVDGAGAVLTLGPQYYSAGFPPAADFVNTGSVVIGAGALFNLIDSDSLAALGTIINGGTLELTGNYTNPGLYSVATGATLLLNGGFTGGTIAAAGGTLDILNAVFTNATVIAGVLALTQGDGGITLAGTSALLSGGGPVALSVQADFSFLTPANNETLDNLVVSFASAGLSFDVRPNAYGSITLGPDTVFDVAGTASELYLVGQFDLTQQSDFDPGTITSQGTIAVGAGADLVVEVSSFANTGTISLAQGAAIIIGTSTSLTAAGLGNVTGSGGTLVVGGTFDVGGGAFDLSASGAIGTLDLTFGTLANGAILGDGGTLLVNSSGALAGATLDGVNFDLAEGAFVNVTGGLSVNGRDGISPGTIAITAPGAEIVFLNSQTFDNATMILSGNAGTFGSALNYYQFPGLTTAGTLTLGANLVVTDPAAGTGGGIGGPGTIFNLGTIAVGAGATIAVTPYGAYTGAPLFTNSGVMTIGAGGLLALDTDVTTASIGTVVETGGTLGLGNFLDNTGATLVIAGGGTLNAVSFGVIAEGQTYVDSVAVTGGTIVNDGGEVNFLGFASFESLTYQGDLFIGAGAGLDLYHSEVTPIGGGAETITLVGALYLSGATLDNTVIAFAGPSAWVSYSAADGLAASLTGFSAGDTIAVNVFGLASGTITTLAYDGTDLVAFDGASAVTTLAVGAGYVASDFAFTSDGFSSYDITTTQTVSQPAPCFVAGTRIATPDGECPVESLAIGDAVLTASGETRKIRWIGRRSYHGRFIAGNRDILPIVIRRGAFADGIPARILRVSPKHAFLLDGVLVEADRLVNGRSIVQLKTVKKLSYLHIELDSHDVLLAEGAPAESFVDRDSRMMFQNAPEFFRIYPRESGGSGQREYAQRAEFGPKLEAIRRRLATRAGLPGCHAEDAPRAGGIDARIDALDGASISGWAFCASQPHTPVHLEVVVDGIAVATVIANAPRDDLAQAGLGRGWCAFSHRFATPLDAATSHDVDLYRNGERLAARSLRVEPEKFGMLDGRIDVCDGRVVAGWARDSAFPDRPVRLEILCDGVILDHAIADRARPDLAAAGLGACGFSIAVDQPAATGTFLVRRAGDGAPVGHRIAQRKRTG